MLSQKTVCASSAKSPAQAGAVMAEDYHLLWLKQAGADHLECPANFVPVGMRQTGMEGAWNGEAQEANA